MISGDSRLTNDYNSYTITIIYNNNLLYIILTVIDNSINDKFLNHLDNYCSIIRILPEI